MLAETPLFFIFVSKNNSFIIHAKLQLDTFPNLTLTHVVYTLTRNV